MDHFKQDLLEATLGNISPQQHAILDEAHRLFHAKHSGPLPYAVQVAIAVITKHMGDQKPTPKPKAVKETA